MTEALLLTASNTFIIGPIAKFFGLIMNLFFVQGVTNLGWCIILFTLIVYIAQLPLTIKQQKFSKMSAIMNPEITKIQKKYKGKRDEESMMLMQAETKEVYAKYGTSPTGGCLPVLIQFPILYAMYRVIYNIPAYVPSIKAVYNHYGLVDMISTIPADSFTAFAKTVKVTISSVNSNTIIDVLWKLQNSTWASLKDLGSSIAGFSGAADQTYTEIKQYTMFLGINIADSPMSIFLANWSEKQFLMCFVAILIPIVSGITQYLNIILMPQPGMDDPENQMAKQMKTMNMMMPLMSVFFCFTLPTGLGLYWIAGAVIRAAEQLGINKYLDKIDINAIIEKNKEKVIKTREKQKETVNVRMSERAKQNTRSINRADSTGNSSAGSSSRSGQAPKPGSLADKANLVRKYEEKNKK